MVKGRVKGSRSRSDQPVAFSSPVYAVWLSHSLTWVTHIAGRGESTPDGVVWPASAVEEITTAIRLRIDSTYHLRGQDRAGNRTQVASFSLSLGLTSLTVRIRRYTGEGSWSFWTLGAGPERLGNVEESVANLTAKIVWRSRISREIKIFIY